MSTSRTAVPLTEAQRRARKYATFLALIATLGPFFYGFEGMVLNAAIKAVGTTFHLGPFLQGVAGAAGVIGGLIGALGAGRISDKIGRKTTLMWVGPFLLFEALLGPISPLLGSFGYPFLLLTRIVGGIGFGAATTVAPGYVAEIAPADIRGRLIGFRQLAIILGLFFAGLINMGVVRLTGGAAKPAFWGLQTWQVLFACLIIPALLFVIFTAQIPESPRYLVSVGKTAEAEAVLAKVSGEDDPAARVKAIAASMEETGGRKLSIGEIFSSKWRGLVSGILLVDHVGRKRMLIYGGTLIFVSLGVVATVFTLAPVVDGKPDVADNPVLAFLAVAALCTFLLGFTSSWGPIFSIVMGEMFPNSIRGGAMSMASGADFFVNFLVVLLFPFLISWSPAGTYWIYCAFGVLAVIFTAKYLKETTGTELEDMDKLTASEK